MNQSKNYVNNWLKWNQSYWENLNSPMPTFAFHTPTFHTLTFTFQLNFRTNLTIAILFSNIRMSIILITTTNNMRSFKPINWVKVIMKLMTRRMMKVWILKRKGKFTNKLILIKWTVRIRKFLLKQFGRIVYSLERHGYLTSENNNLSNSSRITRTSKEILLLKWLNNSWMSRPHYVYFLIQCPSRFPKKMRLMKFKFKS